MMRNKTMGNKTMGKLDEKRKWFEKTVWGWADTTKDTLIKATNDVKLRYVLSTVYFVTCPNRIAVNFYESSDGTLARADIEKFWNDFIIKVTKTRFVKGFHLNVLPKTENKIRKELPEVMRFLKNCGFNVLTEGRAVECALEQIAQERKPVKEKGESKKQSKNLKAKSAKTHINVNKPKENIGSFAITVNGVDTFGFVLSGSRKTIVESSATIIRDNREVKEIIEQASAVSKMADEYEKLLKGM